MKSNAEEFWLVATGLDPIYNRSSITGAGFVF